MMPKNAYTKSNLKFKLSHHVIMSKQFVYIHIWLCATGFEIDLWLRIAQNLEYLGYAIPLDVDTFGMIYFADLLSMTGFL